MHPWLQQHTRWLPLRIRMSSPLTASSSTEKCISKTRRAHFDAVQPVLTLREYGVAYRWS